MCLGFQSCTCKCTERVSCGHINTFAEATTSTTGGTSGTRKYSLSALSLCVLLNVRFVVSTLMSPVHVGLCLHYYSFTISMRTMCRYSNEREREGSRDREWALWSCNPWCSLIFWLQQPSAQPAWEDRPSSLLVAHILGRKSSAKEGEREGDPLGMSHDIVD